MQGDQPLSVEFNFSLSLKGGGGGGGGGGPGGWRGRSGLLGVYPSKVYPGKSNPNPLS